MLRDGAYFDTPEMATVPEQFCDEISGQSGRRPRTDHSCCPRPGEYYWGSWYSLLDENVGAPLPESPPALSIEGALARELNWL